MRPSLRAALAAALLAIFAATACAQEVTNLPGWNATGFGIYAGYVDVGASSSRHLFYVLTASQRSPDTAPLVVWLNGGPGCSSIGGGLVRPRPAQPHLLVVSVVTNAASPPAR